MPMTTGPPGQGTTTNTGSGGEAAMTSYGFLKDPLWRSRVLRDAFGPGFWGFMAAGFLAGVLCLVVRGPEVVYRAFAKDIALLDDLLPRMLVALAVAALIWAMLPRDRMSRMVGQESGLAGLVIATIAGTVTPGGPSSAYALLAMLGASGADRGALVAYITAWATLGLQRVLIWDVPFLGAEFALFRIAISLPLPLLAGYLARKLPLTLDIRPEEPEPERAT